MAEFIVNESSLTSVADAIRERAGTSEPLVFPEGFKSAVEGIPDTLLMRAIDTLTEYSNENITSIVSEYLFYKCKTLVKVNFPNATNSGYFSFGVCTALTDVSLPKATLINGSTFQGCSALTVLDFPLAADIKGSAFWECRKLESLILRKSDGVCVLSNANAFTYSGIASRTGYIYVPKSLVDSYKTATNWSTYASQIRAIEDYPEITGGAV